MAMMVRALLFSGKAPSRNVAFAAVSEKMHAGKSTVRNAFIEFDGFAPLAGDPRQYRAAIEAAASKKKRIAAHRA